MRINGAWRHWSHIISPLYEVTKVNLHTSIHCRHAVVESEPVEEGRPRESGKEFGEFKLREPLSLDTSILFLVLYVLCRAHKHQALPPHLLRAFNPCVEFLLQCACKLERERESREKRVREC